MSLRQIGYCRVSARDQNERRQVIAMREFGIPEENILVEKMSGKDFNRPIYQGMVAKLKPGDTLVIGSLDRLGRDYSAVIDAWRHITKELGADIVVLDMLPLLDTRQKGRDLTASFVADLVLQILSYVSEKERLLNRDRQAAGIAAAKARGVKFGPKPMNIPAEFEVLRKLWKKGAVSATGASKRLGVSRPTFMKWIGRN